MIQRLSLVAFGAAGDPVPSSRSPVPTSAVVTQHFTSTCLTNSHNQSWRPNLGFPVLSEHFLVNCGRSGLRGTREKKKGASVHLVHLLPPPPPLLQQQPWRCYANLGSLRLSLSHSPSLCCHLAEDWRSRISSDSRTAAPP